MRRLRAIDIRICSRMAVLDLRSADQSDMSLGFAANNRESAVNAARGMLIRAQINEA